MKFVASATDGLKGHTYTRRQPIKTKEKLAITIRAQKNPSKMLHLLPLLLLLLSASPGKIGKQVKLVRKKNCF